jgi:hypothetical protein
MPDKTEPSSTATKAAPAVSTRMSIAGRTGTGGRAGRPGRPGRSMPWVRRWARNTFTRDQIASGLRSLLWVAPLTILIWIYAEREQTTKAPVNIPIEVVSTDADRVVTLKRPSDGQISAVIRGPNARLEAVREKLLDTAHAAPVRIEISRNLPTGDQRIAGFASRLLDDPRFTGLTLTDLMPDSIDVKIEEVKRREIPVKAPPGFETYGTATFEPATVTVSGPEGQLNDLGDKLVAYAQIKDRPELNSQQPTVTLKNVKLLLPDNVNSGTAQGGRARVSIVGQSVVTATVELTQPDRYKIPVVRLTFPMNVGIAPPFLVQTSVPRLTNVWVIGPKNEIDQLRNAEAPTATLELPADIQVGNKGTAKLHYNLPPHVQLQRGEDPPPVEQLDYEIVKPGAS